VLAATTTCRLLRSIERARLYGVQFHPEVAHTPCGKTILSNFLFDVCGCVKDWDPAGQVHSLEKQSARSPPAVTCFSS